MRLLLTVILAVSALAQTASFPETTFLQPVTNIVTNQLVLASIQSAFAPGVQESKGVIGSPYGISSNTVMLSWPPPSEAFSIYQVGAAGLTNRVFARRGMYSTYPSTHAQGQLVFLGPANYFRNNNPSGACNIFSTLVLPTITIPSGVVWNCTNSRWVQGIQWGQDIGWWNTTTIAWRSA